MRSFSLFKHNWPCKKNLEVNENENFGKYKMEENTLKFYRFIFI